MWLKTQTVTGNEKHIIATNLKHASRLGNRNKLEKVLTCVLGGTAALDGMPMRDKTTYRRVVKIEQAKVFS